MKLLGNRFSRRELFQTALASIIARRAIAQSKSAPIRVLKLNHFTLGVSDVKRSVDFYQGLFGMPIQARQGPTVSLRIGGGPQFIAITPTGSMPAGISGLSFTVQDFNVDRIRKVLSDRSIPVNVQMRGDTPELTFTDPEGISVQLVDPSYCGGAGPLGNRCATPEPSPRKGLLAVKDLSHFTVFVNNTEKTNAFYQDVFGLQVQARQGPTAPLLGVGDKIQFVMFAGGGGGRGGAPRMASINHVCMNMDGFNVQTVQKALESYGIKPRGDAQGTAPPLVHYVSLRMPNRGGADGGTPELYFTDPDGLLMQLQDVKYCGGGGFLGEVCS